MSKGLIRIALPLPASSLLQFKVHSVGDPYNCTTDPATGLTSPTSGVVSGCRRQLPSTILGFLSTIMSDGREPNLASQATHAAPGPRAENPPTSERLQQIVNFETELFTAQQVDNQRTVVESEESD